MNLTPANNIAYFPGAKPLDNTIEELYALKRARVFMIRLGINQVSEMFRMLHADRRLIVVEGCIMLSTTGGEKRLLQGDTASVPVGVKHRIINLGKIPAAVLELRQGSYFTEGQAINAS